ncbi:MAG: antibiotic biosynthesis monooxygenase family protein [Gaiellaceae bacterium]
MFARIVRYSVDPDRCDEALDAFKEAAEQIGDIDGITGGYVMVDGEAGRIVTVTLWEDREKMEASEVRASRLRQEALRSVEGDVESVERLQIAAGIANEP